MFPKHTKLHKQEQYSIKSDISMGKRECKLSIVSSIPSSLNKIRQTHLLRTSILVHYTLYMLWSLVEKLLGLPSSRVSEDYSLPNVFLYMTTQIYCLLILQGFQHVRDTTWKLARFWIANSVKHVLHLEDNIEVDLFQV